ncbi:PREDICTED: LOW QUALITY PROTEIN: ABI gene family member 3 [Ficedula albicollis]|uniref:LOW QUALITY PROTEIN: ABI gene family member 3 n=1 Tax=Ficedula albicollis TaxID=59894 RepID=UPI0007AD9425|nr:PREDICTED: LOW QUALITY PROTEIN: ABI gene family member 3 [Ficedula albicollis]
MSELERLRLGAIPEGRRLLREQHGNLLRVAEYCQGNYLQASDKRKALEETMALSTQSLASVAYQVSSVASAFLRLLDLQAAQLRQVEADVTCVAQGLPIFPSGPRVAAPPEPPAPEPYYRTALDLSALDGVGHGVKDTSTQLSRTGTLARRSTKGSSAQPGGTLGGAAAPEFGDLAPPPTPAVPEFGDLAPPPPPAAEDPPWAPQNYLEKVVALYPYRRRRTQKDTELSLAPGALLFVTRRFSDGWCEGVTEHESGTGHRSGIFPGNFVEPV